MRILALNAGSSSIKFALFDGTECRGRGQLTKGAGGVRLKLGDHTEEWLNAAPAKLVLKLLDQLERHASGAVEAVGHRIVHGGRDFASSVRVTPTIVERIDALTPLAPLHQPASVAPIRAIAEAHPDIPQVACFDTNFHRDLKPPVSRYPLPRTLVENFDIRRYGFHGLSYEAIAQKLKERAEGAEAQRIIVAHLGSGASLCAMRDLKSVDTTMGFTALDGIMMGTRPGALDPGILLYLLQQKDMPATELEDIFYHRSGLLGVSGLSADVAELSKSELPMAAEALDLFAFSVARETAALAATLGGLDRFVFTGGIGEHSAVVRALVARRLQWLGTSLDAQANDTHAETISTHDSRLRLQVIPTDEEGVIAAHTKTVLGALGGTSEGTQNCMNG